MDIGKPSFWDGVSVNNLALKPAHERIPKLTGQLRKFPALIINLQSTP